MILLLIANLILHISHTIATNPTPLPFPDINIRERWDSQFDTNLNFTLEQMQVFTSALTLASLTETYGEDIVRNLPIYENFIGDISGKVKFYLYSNKTCGAQLKIGNKELLRLSRFNPLTPTKIICHGFMSNYQVGPGGILQQVYLATAETEGYNVILVDWWNLAGATKPTVHTEGTWEQLYFPAAQNTQIVGTQTALLIDFLVKEGGASLDHIHLIGHSLGSHAMGWAGRSISGFNNGAKVSRITGLDPAKPCFEINVPLLCFPGTYTPLDKESAQFVDVIHTYARRWGYWAPLGDADFYPNSGIVQPGCTDLKNTFRPCSHTRAIDYFAQSIKLGQFGFRSKKCENWGQFQEGQCGNEMMVNMGEKCPSNARGNFYLETYDQPPYSKF